MKGILFLPPPMVTKDWNCHASTPDNRPSDTDVNMPRMNGTDLCGHLMEERPGIKVLMMSGGT